MSDPLTPNALHRHTGLLFLGGGNYSLRRDPLSASCLLLAICPRYPSRTIDHQYHLQPLRHLYALAVEPRVLRTIDVDSGHPVGVDIAAELMDGQKLTVEAPALLPELVSVKAVSVLGLKGTDSALDSCRMDSSSSSTITSSSSPRPEYYPNSAAVIHAAPSNHSDAHLPPHDRVVSKQTTRIIIPTLFVKARHRRSYVPAAAAAAALSSSSTNRSCVLPRDADINAQLQKALEHLHTELRRGGGGLHDASPPPSPVGPPSPPAATTTSRTTRTAQDTLSTALRRCSDLSLSAAVPCLLPSGAGDEAASSSRSEFLASILTHTLR